MGWRKGGKGKLDPTALRLACASLPAFARFISNKIGISAEDPVPGHAHSRIGVRHRIGAALLRILVVAG
jgi:hypothetical protein